MEASPKESPSRRVRKESQHEEAQDNECKIYVTGFPKYTQQREILNAFIDCGKLKVERVTPKYAVLLCENRDVAEKAVAGSNIVNVQGQFLTVRLFNPRTDNKTQKKDNSRAFCRSKEKAEIVRPELITLTGDFYSQLDCIMARVRLTQEEVQLISSLYSDVQLALCVLWPGSVALPFGSITTGLGIKTSDADCYLSVPLQYRHPEANFVNKAKRILQQYPATFAEILAIPRASTPIVKFFHIPTGTNCDLSFKTPLGVQNSKLITHLLHCDPKLIPVAVMIKYWAKVHGLSGSGKLSNYALTMLLIFYLQQPPVTMLQSVEFMQRDQTTAFIVDHWNTGFASNYIPIPKSSNRLTIVQLLGGFFEYYSNFKFGELVVCPYLGTPIKKSLFSNPDTLPDEYARYKVNTKSEVTYPLRVSTAMCVQDPFEQSRNVASGMSGRMVVEMVAFFKFAAAAYESDRQNSYVNFLKIILLQRPKIVRKAPHPEFRYNVFPKLWNPASDPDWKGTIRHIVTDVFERIFKLKLTKIDEKNNTEAKNKDKERYWTVMKGAVWRRDAVKSIDEDLDFLQREALITEEILRSDDNPISIEFQIIITYSRKPKRAVITVRLSSGDDGLFIEFGRFFVSIMPVWVETLLTLNRKCSDSDDSDDNAVMDDKSDSSSDSDEDVSRKESVNSVNTDLGQVIDRLGSTAIISSEPEASAK